MAPKIAALCVIGLQIYQINCGIGPEPQVDCATDMRLAVDQSALITSADGPEGCYQSKGDTCEQWLLDDAGSATLSAIHSGPCRLEYAAEQQQLQLKAGRAELASVTDSDFCGSEAYWSDEVDTGQSISLSGDDCSEL